MKIKNLTMRQKKKLAFALVNDKDRDAIFKPLRFMFGGDDEKKIFAEFKTTQELRNAVNIWCWDSEKSDSDDDGIDYDDEKYRRLSMKKKQEKKEIEKKYGHISEWNVSRIDNMERLFAYKHNFNEDISRWDVSRVKNMERMFDMCKSFNKPLNTWDVSQVETMERMFFRCWKFNQPLHRWNTSNVKNMKDMFYYCRSFNQNCNTHDETINDINYMGVLRRDVQYKGGLHNLFPEILSHLTYTAWDVSNVETMESMFGYCENFEGQIDNWNTSKVESMKGMFEDCPVFNSSLNTNDVKDSKGNVLYKAWDVSNVKSMVRMFAYSETFNQNLNNWDVRNVTNMSRMFFKTQSFDLTNIQEWTYHPDVNKTEFK